MASALSIANAKNDLGKVERLLADGAYPTLDNASNPQIIEKLLEAGADPNEIGNGRGSELPLISAVRGNKEDLVRLLIDSGADVNQKGKYGNTPLHVAIDCVYPDMVKLLIDSGADVNKTSGQFMHYLPLQVANKTLEEKSYIFKKDARQIIKLLSEAGANAATTRARFVDHCMHNKRLFYPLSRK